MLDLYQLPMLVFMLPANEGRHIQTIGAIGQADPYHPTGVVVLATVRTRWIPALLALPGHEQWPLQRLHPLAHVPRAARTLARQCTQLSSSHFTITRLASSKLRRGRPRPLCLHPSLPLPALLGQKHNAFPHTDKTARAHNTTYCVLAGGQGFEPRSADPESSCPRNEPCHNIYSIGAFTTTCSVSTKMRFGESVSPGRLLAECPQSETPCCRTGTSADPLTASFPLLL